MIYPFEGKPSWPHSVRGVHLHPTPYATAYLNDREREYHLNLLTRMGISWVVQLTAGDSAGERIAGKPAVHWFLDRGIVPIIRDSTSLLPIRYRNADFIPRLVSLYRPYGLRPTVIAWNEPADNREWRDGRVPPNWREVFLGLWTEAARQIIGAGANVGFPDPLFDWSWFFERMPRDLVDAFRAGRAVFTAHLYGKSRPVDYPEDSVSRYGTPLTPDQLALEVGDMANVPPWSRLDIQAINAARRRLANPNRTWRDDTTCFGAWRHIRAVAREAWGFEPVMCMTEGGWTPNDPAGTGPDIDIRYVPSTPKTVARRTLDIYTMTDHGMYAVCPWILHGMWGWPSDGWIGGEFADVIDRDTGQPYGYEKPVVRLLSSVPPTPAKPKLAEAARQILPIVERIRGLLAARWGGGS